MTKTEITEQLRKSLSKYGWTVKTFNHYRANGRGFKDFPDHFLIHEAKGYFIFIEVKLKTTKQDKLTEGQAEYGRKLHMSCEANGKAMYILFPCVAYPDISQLTEHILKL